MSAAISNVEAGDDFRTGRHVLIRERTAIGEHAVIGAGSFVSAGSVVTRVVPPGILVQGVPGHSTLLPATLDEPNMTLSWRKYLTGDDA